VPRQRLLLPGWRINLVQRRLHGPHDQPGQLRCLREELFLVADLHRWAMPVRWQRLDGVRSGLRESGKQPFPLRRLRSLLPDRAFMHGRQLLVHQRYRLRWYVCLRW
jgi:hypothetical protein